LRTVKLEIPQLGTRGTPISRQAMPCLSCSAFDFFSSFLHFPGDPKQKETTHLKAEF
jgi:hypothetical protein